VRREQRRSGCGVHFGDVGFGHAEIAKTAHGSGAVEHAVVEVEVQHLRAVFYLRLGDFDGGIVLPGHNQFFELNGARNVASLADIDKVDGRGYVHCL
jgi:hypothetical protein